LSIAARVKSERILARNSERQNSPQFAAAHIIVYESNRNRLQLYYVPQKLAQFGISSSLVLNLGMEGGEKQSSQYR
jgi:hypothetical protein